MVNGRQKGGGKKTGSDAPDTHSAPDNADCHPMGGRAGTESSQGSEPVPVPCDPRSAYRTVIDQGASAPELHSSISSLRI